MIAKAEAEHASAEAMAAIRAQAAQFEAIYANPFARFAMTMVEMLPVGVVVAIVSAALFHSRAVGCAGPCHGRSTPVAGRAIRWWVVMFSWATTAHAVPSTWKRRTCMRNQRSVSGLWHG